MSTYFWDKENGGFACAVLLKKEVEKSKGLKKGNWDSINVVDVTVDKSKAKATYRLTCTVMLTFMIDNDKAGDVVLGGNFTKQVSHYSLKLITLKLLFAIFHCFRRKKLNLSKSSTTNSTSVILAK